MLRLVGLVLIVAAGSGVGWLKARRYRQAPGELRQLLGGLQMLSSEIGYTATPLPEAFSRIAGHLSGPAALLFARAARELEKSTGETAARAWQRAWQHYSAASNLGRAELAVVLGVGSMLGATGREDQLRHLELAREQLKLFLAGAEEEARKYSLMWGYLGVCASLALALVIY